MCGYNENAVSALRVVHGERRKAAQPGRPCGRRLAKGSCMLGFAFIVVFCAVSSIILYLLLDQSFHFTSHPYHSIKKTGFELNLKLKVETSEANKVSGYEQLGSDPK